MKPITVDITFSGLCLIQAHEFDPDSWDKSRTRGPRRARNFEILLVKADHGGDHPGADGGDHDDKGSHHRHFPRLTYYAEDHLGLRPRQPLWEPLRYVPSPEGREVVAVKLAGKHVTVIPPYNYKKEWSDLQWCEADPDSGFPEVPLTPSQDTCLDWVLRSGDIGLGEVAPLKAIARVKLPNGLWGCRGAFRNREIFSVDALRWEISPGGPVQAIARDIRLRLKKLRFGPTIRISNLDGTDPQDIVLTPGADRQIHFAVTNLPQEYSSGNESHVPMFSALAQDPHRKIHAPRLKENVVCERSPCEPTLKFG